MITSAKRRSISLLTGAVLVGTTVVLSSAGPAAADSVASARARAAALAKTVSRLQTQAEVATEHYDAIEAELGQAVIRQSLAERQTEADRSAVDAASQQITDRVRAFYESGGQVTLLATVLDGSDPADAMTRMHFVGSILSSNSADVSAAQHLTTQAAQLAAHLSSAASRVTQLQRTAAATAVRIQTLLATQRRALAAANHQVRTMVAAQQAAAAAAAAASFQSALVAVDGNLPTNTKAQNAIAAGAIAAARTRLGDPYVWGATGPNSFDCSGLTQWSYAHVGIHLPRVAADQWNAGPHVAMADLQPGDLLFWATDLNNAATIHHVAIYLGAGMMLAAPHTGDVVKVEPVYLTGYFGATRPYAPA